MRRLKRDKSVRRTSKPQRWGKRDRIGSRRIGKKYTRGGKRPNGAENIGSSIGSSLANIISYGWDKPVKEWGYRQWIGLIITLSIFTAIGLLWWFSR